MTPFRHARIILLCSTFVSLIWLGFAFQGWQEVTDAEAALRLQRAHATSRARDRLAHLKSQIARLQEPEHLAQETPTSPDQMRHALLEAAEQAGLMRVSLDVGKPELLREGALHAFPIRLIAASPSDLEAFRFWRLVSQDPSCTLRFSKWEMRSMDPPPEMMTLTFEGTWVIAKGESA